MEVVATDASWLSLMAVAMNLCRSLATRSLKRHVVDDVKNITGDDQASLRVDQNSTDIVQSFEIFVYKIAIDARWLTEIAQAASCRRQKHHRR